MAVNCWIGSCRKNHILDSFPKLLAYHTVYDGIEYSGPHSKWSMVSSFIMLLQYYSIRNEGIFF